MIRFVVNVGLALGLTMGFIDVTASILINPEGVPSGLLLLSSVVATMLLVFFAYLSTCGLVSLFKSGRNIATVLAVSMFWGSLFTFVTFNGLLSGSGARHLFELGVLSGISLLLSVATYYAWPVISGVSIGSSIVRILGLASPFVFGQILFFVWVLLVFNPSKILIGFAGLLCLVLTLFVIYRSSNVVVNRILISFAILIGLTPVALALGERKAKAEPASTEHAIKHVILLTIDTLRADFLSCYGSDRRPTPNIDRLAKDGILFSNAFSASSWTLPAFASINTGVPPSVHMTTKSMSSLPDTFSTLTEYLHGHGYYTAAIGHNSFLMPERNFSQGYSEYNFFPKRKHITISSIGAKVLKSVFPRSFRITASTAELTSIATDWLNENHAQDFFLWLHYFDPHHPYAPPPQYLPDVKPPPGMGTSFFEFGEVRAGVVYPSEEERDWIRTLYESELLYVDHNVGKVIGTLERLGIYDESLIILTSDHGEEFWEHGSIEHGHTLYNELLNVPLIVKLPHTAQSGNGTIKQIDTAVTTQSLMPTILDLCQIDYDDDNVTVSSLTSLWRTGSQAYEEQPILSSGLKYYEDRISVIFDDFKYIRSLDSNNEELYDLVNDPLEKHNLVAQEQGKLDRGRQLLIQHNDTAANLRDRFNIGDSDELELPKDVLERLRSLGYIK